MYYLHQPVLVRYGVFPKLFIHIPNPHTRTPYMLNVLATRPVSMLLPANHSVEGGFSDQEYPVTNNGYDPFLPEGMEGSDVRNEIRSVIECRNVEDSYAVCGTEVCRQIAKDWLFNSGGVLGRRIVVP